ncbi:MAG: biotin carboxylase N-terminal domain-containing protein [Dehalococcoidia bacterium]
MFKSVLIANRGEIAVRIAKTLRRMGIRSVVVASIPDRRSLAVRSADAWVLLEGYSAAESYLDVDAVIAAAKAEGCEAIHPGYGFLSERADFAERCAAEGITFIGPPPEVLRGMGDKAAARQLAVENDVPVVPGWDGADGDETLVREAARIGYPVMLKARGGGGGRGMREVLSAEELPEAIESARREAQAAFGDGGLLLEKLVTNAHHVEVQVLADARGNVIHLGERDCSVQRRHQKLIEETPSPVVDEALRERLTGYALKLARAIGYVNAGTFEFLVRRDEPPSSPDPLSRLPAVAGEGEAEIYFLEVNPRLQVEHPVTEMVTGLDLVELQLRVAAGEPLPLKQEDVTFEGHAIEFRINAEDPWDGFKPSSGRIERQSLDWHAPDRRVDAGWAGGDAVPSNYDSLIAKFIVHAGTRSLALQVASGYLDPSALLGLRTNIGLHRGVVQHPDFVTGKAGVDWLESKLSILLNGNPGAPEGAWEAVERFLRDRTSAKCGLTGHSPWIGAGGARLWVSDGATTRTVDGVRLAFHPGINGCIHYNNEQPSAFTVFWHGGVTLSAVDDDFSWEFQIVPPPPLPRRAHAATEGATAIVAPLAGTIAAVRVAEGDAVVAGQLLLTLEAMKMEHRITAPSDATVKSVGVRERDTVSEGTVLVELA